MHRIAATPGGWTPDSEGVIIIEQTPAPIVILTAADTDIQTLAAAVSRLPQSSGSGAVFRSERTSHGEPCDGSPVSSETSELCPGCFEQAQFPPVRVVNLLQLQQPLSIDTYAEILRSAQVIIIRLLGGRSYWSYGLEVVKETVEQTDAALFVLPGDDRPDPDLISHSTVSLGVVNQLWRYFTEGGVDNFANALQFVADACLGTTYNPPAPQIVPRVGRYRWDETMREQKVLFPKVGILFYRSHYLAGNTLPIDAICQALSQRNLDPVPVFVSSLRDPEVKEELLTYFQPKDAAVGLILNTTSFSLTKLDLWHQLNVPVLQVIFSSGTVEQWESMGGLSPRDVAMNVALPEVDGRIITRAVSFKSVQTWNESLETDVIVYQPVQDRIEFVADLAANWIRLQTTPPQQRKIALILANYPNRDARIANGVGLDTPASCIEILKELQESGYLVDDIPATGDELIARLTRGITNDPEGKEYRPLYQSLSAEDYQSYFATLPQKVQQQIVDRWGEVKDTKFPISGIQLGNIFIGIQPSRGYDLDPSLNYHAPDLEPTHHYLAYYYWLRQKFETLAIVHVGKHGNLEWLPGKSVALSANCYSEVALGSVPHLYPFIVNDPGEGSQAKRRAGAVIIDHLTPPMTRAELYGPLQQLETLIDEYYEAQTLDPSRLQLIGDRIFTLITQTNLNKDLGIDLTTDIAQFLTLADGYLCELKEAQIRDGLHIFGQCPQGEQLRDLIVAIARAPSPNRLGLTSAIAQDLGLDFEPLTANLGDNYSGLSTDFSQLFCNPSPLKEARTIGDVVEILEQLASQLVNNIIIKHPLPITNYQLPTTQTELQWIQAKLLPALRQTEQEITNLLKGLDGQYVPSAPAGAPTRGRPDVLPTGRNFYSVDIRAIPTETAWDVGRLAAETVIERYTQENGEYPKTLAISIWGTSTMRTGGDDVAQVLALMGVRPVWDGLSRRVVDFEILAPSILGRPRVDVTVRVSGFFRDSFPNLLDLLYQITNAVASLNEDQNINPLAAQVKRETQFWEAKGLETEQANERSHYRIFGSKPGAYGAGLQGLIEAQNWADDADLARAYINWSAYAYSPGGTDSVPEVFEQRLKQLQIVLHNQDNREHDLLDSDDYYQFQGGLTAAVRSLTGHNPQTYFGDNSVPANPKVRKLTEEIARVYRSRVVNPKWIQGVMRHGYKGAFEMAATVDYLFAYDATARCVSDYMYQGVAEAYIFNEEVQEFTQQKNPWALRDMAERLLEAHQRGLWESAHRETIEKLKETVNYAEGVVEEKISLD